MLSTHSRNGLSIVEFVGCLAALIGGVVLGAVYLGVDVKSVAVEVLNRSQVIDPSLIGLSTEEEAPEAHAEESAENFATVDSPLGTEQSSTANANNSVYAAPTPVAPPGAEVLEQTGKAEPDLSIWTALANPETREYSHEQRSEATYKVWQTLTEAIHLEATHRSPSLDASINWQLFDYLTHRKENHQKVVDLLEDVQYEAVDQRLIIHAQQVLTWHKAGVRLFDRSLALLTDSPAAEFSGPSAQSWQSAATQHRMEEKLLRDKHLALATYLQRTYPETGPFDPAPVK